MEKIIAYARQRAGETSTWRGITLIVTAVGVPLNPVQADAIVAIGLAVAGVIGAFFPDAKSPADPGAVK